MSRIILVALIILGFAAAVWVPAWPAAQGAKTIGHDDEPGYYHLDGSNGFEGTSGLVWNDGSISETPRLLTDDEILKDPMAPCQAMAVGQVRRSCFLTAQSLIDAQRRLISYTVILYGCAGEIARWQAKDLAFVGGIEFTDVTSGHRIRLEDNWAVESTGDKIYSSDDGATE